MTVRRSSQSLQKSAIRVPRLCQDRFLPYPFQIITHLSSKHSTLYNLVFFLVSWGGVRLSPLGTSATKAYCTSVG
jgi:hypothetical protein